MELSLNEFKPLPDDVWWDSEFPSDFMDEKKTSSLFEKLALNTQLVFKARSRNTRVS